MTTSTSPFHAGEKTIQSLAGVRDRIELKGRAVIRDYMPEQHRAFFAALPFMVVGWRTRTAILGHHPVWAPRVHEFAGRAFAYHQSMARSGRSFALLYSGWCPGRRA